MTFVHVLGGVSLLVLVAVSTVIRAGIGVDHADVVQPEQDAVAPVAGEAPASVAEPVAEPVAVLVTPQFGPLLDRMRP